MPATSRLRIAMAGLGGMGYKHLQTVASIDRFEVAGICDMSSDNLQRAGSLTAAPRHREYSAMLDKERPDAVFIATPHWFHVDMAIEALRRGIHVLVEKPVGVHGLDVRRAIAAHEEAKRSRPDLVFAAMFNMRTADHWRKIKAMVDGLGRLVRVTWIATDWFRTQHYYGSGSWRATWKGEGGGLLLNQCPHNLDMLQWLVGMPERITGFASLGKYHRIEVEDEVSAFFEYHSGAVGHFIATTAESPGTNRLEIAGENGRLVFENGTLVLDRNGESMLKNIETATTPMDKVACQRIQVPYEHEDENPHLKLIENFAEAVLDGVAPIAPAAEGLKSVLLSNAILHSSLNGHRPVEMPMDEAAFEKELLGLIARSTARRG